MSVDIVSMYLSLTLNNYLQAGNKIMVKLANQTSEKEKQ